MLNLILALVTSGLVGYIVSKLINEPSGWNLNPVCLVPHQHRPILSCKCGMGRGDFSKSGDVWN